MRGTLRVRLEFPKIAACSCFYRFSMKYIFKQPDASDLVESFGEMGRTTELLTASIKRLERAQSDNPELLSDPTWRSDYIRAYSTRLESIAAQLRRAVLVAQKRYSIPLDNVHRLELEKERMSPVRSVRTALHALNQLMPESSVDEITQSEWAILQHVIDLRNRLTHPRKAIDLHVSDFDFFAFLVADMKFQKAIYEAASHLMHKATNLHVASKVFRRATEKPRPNAPCPCGSSRKYKKCHGAPRSA